VIALSSVVLYIGMSKSVKRAYKVPIKKTKSITISESKNGETGSSETHISTNSFDNTSLFYDSDDEET
jgi:hypothetical protein